MSDQEMLELKFESRDLNRELTIKEYLKELLKTLWEEGEGFSGKRPFGNSGWTYELEYCLVKNDIVEGVIDQDGYVSNLDRAGAHATVARLIGAL